MTTIDDLPFDFADRGRLKVESAGDKVYLVTWKDAIEIEQRHAVRLGFDLLKEARENE
ncbi:MAG: hypothetical protein HQRvContig01_20 [Haloquadratum phage sp.]|nr:MAG: hypothetical protein HQRvContig01_20 [Haloquadratum phage sp.]